MSHKPNTPVAVISGRAKSKGPEVPATPRVRAKSRRRKPPSGKVSQPVAGREQHWQRFMQYAKKKGTRS